MIGIFRKTETSTAAKPGNLADQIEDLDALRQHLGAERVDLLGHSWGGLLAMEYATRHSNRVSHLILLNSAPGSHADLLRFRQQREAAEPGTLATMRAKASGKFGDTIQLEHLSGEGTATAKIVGPRTLESLGAK